MDNSTVEPNAVISNLAQKLAEVETQNAMLLAKLQEAQQKGSEESE